MFKEAARNKYILLMMAPGFLFLAIFAYLPMYSYLIAFKHFNVNRGIWGSEWAGFSNFTFFFTGSDWLDVTRNTVVLNLLFLCFGLLLALLIALFLNEMSNVLFKKVAQSIVLLPYFISWVIVSFMVTSFLNSSDGLINRTLEQFGIEGVSWYSTPQPWPVILTLVYVWKISGYFSIIFLAVITGISSDYYESARMDGASRLQQMRHITLPMVVPTAIILALLGIGRIFYGDFGMIYGIVGDNGVLFPTTDVIDTYSYRAMRKLGNFSMSSAVILYQAVLGLAAIVLFNWMVRRMNPESALF